MKYSLIYQYIFIKLKSQHFYQNQYLRTVSANSEEIKAKQYQEEENSNLKKKREKGRKGEKKVRKWRDLWWLWCQANRPTTALRPPLESNGRSSTLGFFAILLLRLLYVPISFLCLPNYESVTEKVAGYLPLLPLCCNSFKIPPTTMLSSLYSSKAKCRWTLRYLNSFGWNPFFDAFI